MQYRWDIFNRAKEPSAYAKFTAPQLILRDELAIDRTILANERTLLAYLRSGVAIVIAGISMIHFSQTGWFFLAGAACIPFGGLCTIIGILRYIRMNAAIHQIGKQIPLASTDNKESTANSAAVD